MENRAKAGAWVLAGLAAFLATGLFVELHHPTSQSHLSGPSAAWRVVAVLLCLPLLALLVRSVTRALRGARPTRAKRRRFKDNDVPTVLAVSSNPLGEARALVTSNGYGSFLGWSVQPDGYRYWQGAPADSTVCVLAPPRAGKTRGVVMPTVITAPGAVVVTSTKRDVLDATVQIRERVGQVWLFDPSDDEALPQGAKFARWTPIQAAKQWDGARNMASAMIAASIVENYTSSNAQHFIDRATDTLAPMLFAAHHGNFDISHVTDWLYQNDATPALEYLNEMATLGDANSYGAGLAFTSLSSVAHLEERERSSVWSTATRIVSAYMTEGARAAASNPNFDPEAFVMSTDALYIASPDNLQRLYAPIIVGLLAAIKTATYDRQRRVSTGEIPAQKPVVMVLDECANIAPIAELPTWLSTAGGNGLHLVVVFQDLSQVAGRWGRSVADGLLTLCPTKVVMGGIADPTTLHALSEFIGDYDREVTSTSTHSGGGSSTTSTSVSTQRTRRLEPSQIAQLPRNEILLIDRNSWGHLNIGFWDDEDSLWPVIARDSKNSALNNGELATIALPSSL